jgi:glycosyltransferase involved in cell wall biosynthesis
VLEVNADLLEQRSFKGIPERGLRRLFAVWATRICFNAAAKIVCISAGLKDHLSRKWHIQDSKLTVLPCAADVEVFGRLHNAEPIRRDLGLTTEPVVMWVGGYYPWHDLDLLLDSFVLLLQEHANAKLVLVGDGPIRQSIIQKVQEKRLQPSVIMTGAIAHANVPEMLSIADVAVVPSAPIAASRGGTGTPLKLFEYMAAAKPIVATNLNQAAEVIQDGHTGLLVEAGNVKGFAEAMLRLLNDPMKRIRLSQNARQQAIELYSWEEYTRRLEEIYLNVLGKAPSGSPATAIT